MNPLRALVLTSSLLGLTAAATAIPPLDGAAPPPAKDAEAPAAPAVDGRTPNFLRVDRDGGRRVALEIATTTYEREDRPSIDLVGVAHIADATYYAALQEQLDGYDLVLYESVKPSGTGGAGGATEAERADSTTEAMRFLGGIAASYQKATGSWPDSVEVLRGFAAAKDPRLAAFVVDASTDAWGRPLRFTTGEFGGAIESYGADGAEGGTGEAADLRVQPDPDAGQLAFGGSTLQGDLAKALGLAFQLEAIDYGRANWVCSDMAIDQVNRRLAEKGVDFGLMEDTLAGGSFPARIVKVLLGVIRFADRFLDGAVSDTVKVVLIEMLGDESIMEMSLGQMPGMADVIIDDRNQVVVDDLASVLETLPADARVAVFYGAGHMQDLHERLGDQLGYTYARSRWRRAIEIDLRDSAVTERDVDMVRSMIKRSLPR